MARNNKKALQETKENTALVVIDKPTFTWKNEALAKHIEAIGKEIDKTNEGAWRTARHIISIIDGKLYEEDFKGGLVELYEFLGISKKTVSLYKNALEYRKNNEEIVKNNGMTIKSASLYNSLRKENKEIEFNEWKIRNGIKTASNHDLEEAIAAFRKGLKAIPEKTRKNYEKEGKEPDEAKTAETELEGAVKVVVIEYNDVTVSVPVSEFRKTFNGWVKKYNS